MVQLPCIKRTNLIESLVSKSWKKSSVISEMVKVCKSDFNAGEAYTCSTLLSWTTSLVLGAGIRLLTFHIQDVRSTTSAFPEVDSSSGLQGDLSL